MINACLECSVHHGEVELSVLRFQRRVSAFHSHIYAQLSSFFCNSSDNSSFYACVSQTTLSVIMSALSGIHISG